MSGPHWVARDRAPREDTHPAGNRSPAAWRCWRLNVFVAGARASLPLEPMGSHPGDPPFTCGRWAPWNRAAHPALRNPRDLQNGVQPWTPARRRAGGPQRSLLPPGAVTRKAAGPPQGQEGRRPCLFGEGPVALPPRCPVFKGRKLFRGCFGLRTFHGRAVLLWHLQTGGGNSDSSADRLRQQTPLGKFTRERKAR